MRIGGDIAASVQQSEDMQYRNQGVSVIAVLRRVPPPCYPDYPEFGYKNIDLRSGRQFGLFLPHPQ